MFISVIALAMSMMAMATESAYVQIKLTGENGGASNIFLFEDDAYSNAFEPSADVEKMMSQSNSKSVLLYAFVDAIPCEDVVAANLDGLNIGFATNQVDVNYTLSFIDFEGRTLTLYDRVANEVREIVAGGTYSFSVDASLVGRHQINDRFFINLDASDFDYTVTTNEFGWASYSLDVNAAIPAGLQVFKGVFDGQETLDLTEMDWLAANEGVVVLGEPNTLYHFFAGVPQQSSFDGNDLKASSKWADRSGSIFCLKGDALYEYTGENFPANKAFLEIPASNPNGAPRRISFRFNGTQAVDNVADEAKAVKFMENGQVIVIKNGVKFNTLGQIVK